MMQGRLSLFMRIGIIGGAGHVGLPLGLLLSDAGHTITLIDKKEGQLETISNGEMPFQEEGTDELLTRALRENKLQTTTDITSVEKCDATVLVVGTPIDDHNNPKMENLLTLVEEIEPYLDNGHLLTMRSTVYPGTTAVVRDTLEDAGRTVGEDVFLSFAPERTAQHKALVETVQLPQLIGTFEDASYARTQAFFEEILQGECHRLTPTEAELGKLFTNMWRYLTFAAANEFYLISETFSEQHEVNVHRILDRTAQNYPRFDVPSPGANVGGPCLTKDGWFLVDNIPYNELVSAAFQINEGMPAQIIRRMRREHPEPDRITILGMTFKPESDDTRNSVAFKLKRQLRHRGYSDIIQIEPNVDRFDTWEEAAGSDWVILMTPHSSFSNLQEIRHKIDNEDCLYCDVWGHWEEARYISDNGYFTTKDIGIEHARS